MADQAETVAAAEATTTTTATEAHASKPKVAGECLADQSN